MALPIIQEGSFDASIRNLINLNFQQAMGTNTGNLIFLDPANGFDGNSAQFPSTSAGNQGPVRTLANAYQKLRSGYNDVVVLIGNGGTGATARLSSAFTWAKSAAHMVGVCSDTTVGKRARIAPTSGITAFANFFTVSGSGCLFSDLQWFQGFGTGTTAQICITVSGGRNRFQYCDIQGMGDAVSAQDAGSRNVLIQTTGENTFDNCTIGLDTIARTTTNASVEFTGGCPRNTFLHCLFPFLATNAGVLGVKTAANGASDRFQLFEDCLFVNAVQSTGTAMTALSTLHASQGGMHVYRRSTIVGITGWGTDATSKGQMYLDGFLPSNACGIAVNPA